MSSHSFDRQPRDGSSSTGSHQNTNTNRGSDTRSPRQPARPVAFPQSETAVSQADGAA